MINKLISLTKIIEYFFPKFCVGCQKEGVWLCQECQKDILFVKSQVCPKCQRLSTQGKYCSRCKDKEIYLKGILTAAYFEEGPTKEIIHNFKYNSVIEFKMILGETLMAIEDLPKVDIISFTPLHPKRFAQRGYNQSEILAEEVARNEKWEMRDVLEKVKHTKKQVGLKGDKRRKNLKGVFRVKNNLDIKGKKIIVVDDITTTGTTLNENARVLKEAGAKEVWGLVVARG